MRPHAVTAVTTTTPGQTAGTTAAYAYDAIGNMTTRPTTTGAQTLSWDPEGRLAKVTQAGNTVEENLFDAEGARLIRRDPAGATLFTDPESGRTEIKNVTATHSNTDTYLTKLTVRTTKNGRTSTAVLSTTENHPFWEETTGSWVDAGRLVPGTSLLHSGDGIRHDVVTVVNYVGRQNMRDLTVADIHTYYVLAGNTPVLVHNCNLPAGFAGKAEYNAFVGTLDDGLAAAGHGGTRAAFQGNSVTGVSFRSGRPFGSHSDYDVALGGDAIFTRAKELGIPLRQGGTRTGPLKGAHLDALGLTDLRTQLSGMAGREVNFMVYSNIDNAMARSPSLPAVGCGC